MSADTNPHVDTVSFDLDLHHTPEKVWRALSDPSLIARWLLPVVDHGFAEGATFKLQAPPQAGWDGAVNCRYLEIDAPTKLSWAWVVGDIDTVVTITLTPTTSGTRMSLVQSGFKAHQKQNAGGARYGWRMMSDKLVELLEALP